MATHAYHIRHQLALFITLLLLTGLSVDPVLAQRGRTDAGQRVERRTPEKARPATTQGKRGDARRADNRADNRADRRQDDRRRADRRRADRRVDRRPARVYVAPKHRPARVYVTPRPRVDIRVNYWPWHARYQRHWAPRYTYRQVIVVNNRPNRRERVEFETTYRHRVAYADDFKAVLVIDIESITVYSDGRWLGVVDRIPTDLSRVEATVYRDGHISFDTDIFLLGDRRRGFELVSTYNQAAGKLDFRRERVRQVNRSRFSLDGYVPISLIPEGEEWLWEEGVQAIR